MHKHNLIYFIASLFLCANILEGQNDTSLFRVQILVNTSYSDSPESLDSIKLLSENLPPFKAFLPEGSTISHLMVQNYGFGPTDETLDSTGQYLLNRILAINEINQPGEALPGEILMPSIPKRAFTTPNLENVNNTIPKQIELYPGNINIINNENFLFDTISVVDDYFRAGSSTANLEFDISYAILDSLLNTPLGRSSSFKVLEGGIDFAFEENNIVNTEGEFQLLDDKERKELSNLIGQSQRKVNVFILDSGWPSKEAYEKSIRFFHTVMDDAWADLKIENPASREMPPFTLPSCKHCTQIESALKPLDQLDPSGNAVRIIYLPLSKEQGGNVLLKELIWFNQITKSIQKNSDISRIGDILSKRIIKQAGKDADRILSRLPSEIGVQQSGSQSGEIVCKKSIRTDIAILNAIVDVATISANRNNSAFFLNISWNPKRKRKYKLSNSDVPVGAFVIATGNSPRDVIKEKKPFGNLVNFRGDVVAVVNMDPNSGAPNCQSGYVESPASKKGIVVGYHGNLTATNCGGTSFAAPRIAWFIALGESLKSSLGDDYNWIIQLEQGIESIQDFSSNDPFLSISFEPLKYFNHILK